MLQLERHDRTAVLTLDRPARGNALSVELVDALLAQVLALTSDSGVDALVFQASGAHFCTGFDLSGLAVSSEADLLQRFVRVEQLLQAVWQSPIRTIALAQGRTWGAGADLFAACEVRLATPGASFRFPGARFGIVLGTRRLAERVGGDTARRWLLDSAHVDAASAQVAGLATELVDAEGLAAAWCAHLPGPIDRVTAAAIRRLTRVDAAERDMSELVASAARPGLKTRMTDYLAALRA